MPGRLSTAKRLTACYTNVSTNDMNTASVKRYHSPLRQGQAEETRQRLLRTVAELLARDPDSALAYAELATPERGRQHKSQRQIMADDEQAEPEADQPQQAPAQDLGTRHSGMLRPLPLRWCDDTAAAAPGHAAATSLASALVQGTMAA